MGRVLIVEDHGPTRVALRRVFAREGWDVCMVGTVAKGLAALEPHPTCVILDLCLPDGDGAAILRKIREGGLPTRIVMVTTGVGDPARLAEVAKLRPDVTIMKPMDPEALCRLCGSEVGG